MASASSSRHVSSKLEFARRYCRRLARGHYENFIVGSVLIPRAYIQHLYNIYAFCRYSDDLADEISDSSESLRLLNEWKDELQLCYGGAPQHPILIALQDTIASFDIPPTPFLDLISAFKQDCQVTRYETYAELLDYCTRSANPVGRLFLLIFGYRDSELLQLSDKICTGLQLANFWQDIAQDYQRNRVYIPREDMRSFGCTEKDIHAGPAADEFRELVRFQVERTREMFAAGRALPPKLTKRLSIDIELFRRGGLAVLTHIEGIDYDVLSRRPSISKLEKARMFASCLVKPPR